MSRRALAFAFCLVIAGCGDLSRAELKRGVESLDSVAVEGRILAAGVVGDRTKTTFTRVRAKELIEDAQHEAEKLADATPEPAVLTHRDTAVNLAGQLAETLLALEVFPGDERRATKTRDALVQTAHAIEDLDARLKDAP